MTPGKNQITLVAAEVHTYAGPSDGVIRVQQDGIFIAGDKSDELGLTWNELLRLIEHPAIAEELDAHSIGFDPKPSP